MSQAARFFPGRRWRWALLGLTGLPATAVAQAGEGVPDLGMALVKMLAALGLVLGVFALGVYFLKRFGLVPWTRQGGDLRIERMVSLGYRSRMAIVQASGQRFLVGITPTQIQRIAELPENGNDAADDDAGSR
ncbi:FliO/MopB family protein [Thiohalorhabdus sp.]|uniref:FliO/MopB family protein n=1 Tax=Thiohalorhabdus sp. TaxID=3094134 RepID=UPI002FC2BAC5